MGYTVTCDCGQTMVVRAGDAGAQKICGCGASVAIPSLSALRQSDDISPSATQTASMSPAVFWGIMGAVLLIVALLAKSLLVPLGVLMILAARWWFAALILSEMGVGNALIVFFIPFMPTLFFVKRFDVAWKPFFFGISGVIVAIVGGFLSAR